MLTPHYDDGRITLYAGDCLEVLRELPAASVDSVTTDPPYGLEFMGREWDSFRPANARLRTRQDQRTNPSEGKSTTTVPEAYVAGRPFQAWCEVWARECLRVLKPGGYLLAFGGTRTWHRLACAVEDAGFEIRDSITWCYGSGFPKSHSVHKATLSAVESRYGSARCGCLDPRHGRADRDGVGREGRGSAGAVRAGGEVPAAEAGASDLPLVTGASVGAVRELWEADEAEAAGPATLGTVVLRPAVRGCGSEATGLGDAAVRPGVEEPAGGGSAAGYDLPGVRQDARAERVGPACASPAAIPVRGDEPTGEPGGAVRLLSPHDRGSDRPGAGVDPGRSDPRRLHPDGDGRGSGAVARVCSCCGLPDVDWLADLEALGTALKPASEPIVVARKPLAGTVAQTVLAHGTGALNIDACRVDGRERTDYGLAASTRGRGDVYGIPTASADFDASKGRWPANVVFTHDESCGPDVDGCVPGCPVAELDAQSGELTSGGRAWTAGDRDTSSWRAMEGRRDVGVRSDYARPGDAGGASRFFPTFRYEAKAPTVERPRAGQVAHPTVKPLDLMRWLVRLVTPPGGVVLDPFAGSGTTGEAAVLEGFRAVLVEREADYLPLILDRLTKRSDPVAHLTAKAARGEDIDLGLFGLLDEAAVEMPTPTADDVEHDRALAELQGREYEPWPSESA